MNFLLLVRLGWVERRIWPVRIHCDAASLGELRVVIRTIPIAAPLPDVAGHVVKAVTIRRKFRDRCDAGVAIFARVLANSCAKSCQVASLHASRPPQHP